jgi:hypothetical protein
LDRNLSAFSTLFAPGKSWDNVRSTAAPYTEPGFAQKVCRFSSSRTERKIMNLIRIIAFL